MTETSLVIIDPDTGEAVDLTELSDRELDEMHLYLSIMRREYERLEGRAWELLRQRAIDQGGLNGSRRRWTVERRVYQAATPELKRGVGA